MFSRGPPDLTDSSVPSASSASGLFRGLLSNVSNTVSGGSASTSALEARVAQLTEDICVLQEELESKIVENERLVMEGSEVRRSKREVEMKVEEIESEIVQAKLEAASATSEKARVDTEKKELVSQIESFEIQVDGLKREVLLQQEATRRNQALTELLEARLAHMTTHSADVEAELRQVKSNLQTMESRASQTQRSLELSEAERQRSSQALLEEKSVSHSHALRVTQLEEELSIASLQTSGSVTPFANDSVLPCAGDPTPCCYRSEYFRDKYRAALSNVDRISSKLSIATEASKRYVQN